MKIAVISDTHSLAIPKKVIDELKGVDMIIHAGDFCCMADYKNIISLNNTKAVWGNMDDSELKNKLPRREILDVEGVKIGLFHGEGSPHNIVKTIKNEFAKDDIQVVVFGHSHQPMNERVENVLFFNPGSPNDTVRAPYRSYGILEVKSGQVKAKIVKIE